MIKTCLKLQEWELTIHFGEKYIQRLQSKKSQNIDVKSKTAFALRSISTAYSNLNGPQKSISYIEKSINLMNECFGDKSAQNIENYFLFGCCLSSLKKYREAAEWYKKLLETQIQIYGEYHGHTESVFKLLATSYASARNKEKAIEYCKKIEEIILKDGNIKNNLRTWEVYNFYGGTYLTLGECVQAIENFKIALKFTETFKEENLRPYYSNIIGIATTFQMMNNYKEAIIYYLQAKDILLKIKSNTKVSLALLQINLGDTYFKIGDYLIAINTIQNAEIILKKNIGNQNEFVAEIDEKLGKYYQNILNYAWSIEYYERSLRINEIFNGEYSCQVARLCSRLAELHNNIKSYDEALNYYKRCEKIIKVIGNTKDIDFYSIYRHLINAYVQQKKYDLAYEYCTKSMEISKKDEVKEPLSHLYSLFLILHLHVAKGEFQECAPIYKEIEELIKMNKRGRPLFFALIYIDFATIFSKAGDYKLVIKYQLQAADIFKYLYDGNSPYIFNMYFSLAVNYERIKDYANAADYYQKIISVFNKFSTESDMVRQSFYSLANIYKLRKNYKMAIEISIKALNFLSSCDTKSNRVYSCYMYHILATIYITQINFHDALDCYNNSLELLSGLNDKQSSMLVRTYSNIAWIYANIKETKLAYDYYKKADCLLDSHFNKKNPEIIEIYRVLAKGFYDLKEYILAIKNAEIVDLFYKSSSKKDYIGIMLNLKFLIQSNGQLENYDKAIRWLKKVELIFCGPLKNEIKAWISFYESYCFILWGKQQYNLVFAILAENIRKSIHQKKDQRHISNLYLLMGCFYYKASNIKNCLCCYYCALKIKLEIKPIEENDIGIILIKISQVYSRIKERQIALNFAKKAKEVLYKSNIQNKKLLREVEEIFQKN